MKILILMGFISLALALPESTIAHGSGGSVPSTYSKKKKASTPKQRYAPAKDRQSAYHVQSDKKGPVGFPGNPRMAKRSVQVTLSVDKQLIFKKDLSKIDSGTVLQFRVKNESTDLYEFSIKGLHEHENAIQKISAGKKSIGNTILVHPEDTSILTWHFEGEGIVVFSGYIPGAYEEAFIKKATLVPLD